MRRIPVILLCACLTASPVLAKEKASKPNSAVDEQVKKQREKITEIKDSIWTVDLVSGDPKNPKIQKDELIFSNGNVMMKSFADRFAPVGYTVTPQEDGTAFWENYQENKEGSLAISGVWDGDAMRGGIVERSADGKKSASYSFTSKRVPAPVARDKAEMVSEEKAASQRALVSKEGKSSALKA